MIKMERILFSFNQIFNARLSWEMGAHPIHPLQTLSSETSSHPPIRPRIYGAGSSYQLARRLRVIFRPSFALTLATPQRRKPATGLKSSQLVHPIPVFSALSTNINSQIP